MKTAKTTIDFSQTKGTIRRLNGGNIGPRLWHPNGALAKYQELEIPITRLHDAALGNFGLRIVDTQNIFGNWRADQNNPDNYYFRQTDNYLWQLVRSKSKIVYRLGPSIEHLETHYHAHPPEDYEKWADICINIIRHYNEGWNNGFSWDIEYWEIWNEPDLGSCMWSGSMEEYLKLYEVAAKKIKDRFPNVKVGGPALTAITGRDGKWGEAFLARCRERNIPLDFFSWHSYAGDPAVVIDEPKKARKFLDKYGFKKTELHLNEWHYWYAYEHNWEQNPRYSHSSARAAVHATSVLTGWQDTPIDAGCFYTIGNLDIDQTNWGAWSADVTPNKIFYAFKAFAEVARHPKRVKTESNTKNVRVLAGLDDSGAGVALVSDFTSSCENIVVKIEGASVEQLEVLCLDEEKNLEAVPVQMKDGIIYLPTPKDESSVYLLRGFQVKEEVSAK